MFLNSHFAHLGNYTIYALKQSKMSYTITLPLCRLVQWSDLSIGYILLDIGSNVCCYTDGTGRPSQLHRTSHHVINAGYRL